jgi:hypothetical protein
MLKKNSQSFSHGDDNKRGFLGVVGGGRGVGRGGLVSLSLGVDGGTLVGDLSNVAVVVVSGVGNGLDSAVGKGNLVGTGDVAAWVGGLGGLEVRLGVVIGNTVLESIRFGLFLLGVIGSGGVVGGGGRGVVGSGGRGVVGSGCRCVVSRGGVVDNGGSVVHDGSGAIWSGVVDSNGGSVVGSGVVDNWGGVVGSSTVVGRGVHNGVAAVVVDGTVGGSNLGQTLGVVSLVDGGVGSAEGLLYLHVSHLTVSLGDGLVGCLTGITVMGSDGTDGSGGGNAHQSGNADKGLKKQ